MVRSYLLIAFRNIAKRKLYSFINSFGLSISIASCMLIILFISDEKSFDRFHVNKDRIFRIEEKKYNIDNPDAPDRYIRSASLQAGLKQALKDEVPEITYATRFNSGVRSVFRYEDKLFSEKITYVDRDFFHMFSFPILEGSKEKLFSTKAEIVITPSIATKYFGDEDPLGKTMLIGSQEEKPYIITGIIAEPPANSSLDFTILMPQENRSNYEKLLTLWTDTNSPTFVQLAPVADLKPFGENLTKFLRKHQGDRLARWEQFRREATFPIPDDATMLSLDYTALPDIHLKKEVEWAGVSDPQYSFILGGIAFLILVIACINYISLALTTSLARRKEVGMRKVVGALKSQLIRQFGLESLVLVLISMFVGFGLVILCLPFFNQFTGKEIALNRIDILQFISVSLGMTILVGALAGSYPAFFLSGFRPALVLKGRFNSKLHWGFTRPLVTLQFALSAFLIFASVVMNRQMEFVASEDLGFDQELVMVIPTQTGWNIAADDFVQRFRHAFLQDATVISVAGTSASFNRGSWRNDFKHGEENKTAFLYAVDQHYIETLGLQLLQGRNFDPLVASDTNAIIVNEAMVRQMHWKDPLNEYLNWRPDNKSYGDRVIGVVKDYHFLSLDQEIGPVILSIDRKRVGYLSTMLVKIAPGDLARTVSSIRETWKQIAPDKPFEYTFLDEDLTAQYRMYQQWTDIMALATGMAILIACLGLFGLSGIKAVNRTKEIGIRKVMGAGLKNIFVLLNKEYVWLSLVAFVLAVPASWYAMNKWLSSFQFHIPINWSLFVLSMFIGLAVAILSVSYHAIRAALLNPAETLKHE